MKQLKINVPETLDIAYDEGTATISINERPKAQQKITDRFKTIEGVLKVYGWDSESDFNDAHDSMEVDERAYLKLKFIVKALNEGWKPNWDDSNEGKYSPWFYLDGGSSGFRFGDFDGWDSHSYVGSRLCFKSRELAEYAAKQFLSTYKEFMV